MKTFFSVPNDLYVHVSDIAKLERGESAHGYIIQPTDNIEEYEQISKHAFLSISDEHVINENTFSVCFIMK